MNNYIINKLNNYGITIDNMAEIVYNLQIKYNQDLNIKECKDAILSVLKKREVENTILTGLAIDKLVQDKLLDEPIQSIIESDNSLYGVDETLALGILNLYGTIAFTNFGYLDKEKPGIIGIIDNKNLSKECHTFLDDIIAAIIAAAISKIAHNKRA